MLHIVNGDCVGDKLRAGNIGGDILVWREVYPAGPVFLDPAAPSNRSQRAEYLERTLGISATDYISGCEAQERSLRDFRKHDEVALWFEHDLFDQLMLSCLLHWFAGQTLGHAKLNLLEIGGYPGIEGFRGLGQLTTGQLEALSGTWRRIGQKELETGGGLWEAYCSPDIERHAGLLHEDTSALPFARSAFDMHLSRLPSASNGLGIVEQTALELIRQGATAPHELFEAIGNRLNGLGMGDLEFGYRLREMAEGPNALIRISDSKLASDDRARTHRVLGNGAVALTETGAAVVTGSQDWLKLRGMNEHYGGLRLDGDTAWRWDAERQRLVYPA